MSIQPGMMCSSKICAATQRPVLLGHLEGSGFVLQDVLQFRSADLLVVIQIGISLLYISKNVRTFVPWLG